MKRTLLLGILLVSSALFACECNDQCRESILLNNNTKCEHPSARIEFQPVSSSYLCRCPATPSASASASAAPSASAESH